MLEPLMRAGKMGVVLLQFAPWFAYGPKSFLHIEGCLDALPGFRVGVEFRNPTWFSDRNRERTLEFERSLGIVHVVADDPGLRSVPMSPPWATTDPDMAMVRLHGRSEDNGNGNTPMWVTDRLECLYSRRQLEQLLPRLRRLSFDARHVHVLFNNGYADNAQRNARQLSRMLESRADDAALAAAPV
jgi:uncharacterized protein YecE (DUF72 family)